MGSELVYGIYGVAALGALVTYLALPKASGGVRRGVLWTLMAIAAGAGLMLLGRILGEQAGRVYFCILAALTLAGGIGVVTHRRPVYSALFFIVVVLSTAGLMFLVGAEFLGAALVIVYAGAILVTYVFVIMLAQQSVPTTGGQFAAALDYDRSAREPLAAILAGFVLVGVIGGAIAKHDWSKATAASPANASGSSAASTGNVLEIGGMLMSPQFAVSVELAGVLLMVAMIGAIAIARKKVPHELEDGGEERRPGEIGRHVKPF